MQTVYQNIHWIQNTTPTFFAGANTERGFVGEYDHFATEEENARVWILKGGSGTGKSTFMSKLATSAIDAGHSCVRYLCSSDPTSLDAVRLDGKYVILDGTAPHVREMAYPGAVSEILYLGKYWDKDVLAAKRTELIAFTQQKKEAYAQGYALLTAAAQLETETYVAAMTLLDHEKLHGWVERLLRGVGKAERCGGTHVCRTWAITMRGLYRTDGLAQMAGDTARHWCIADSYQTAPVLLAVLAEACQAADIPVWLSLHPIHDRVVEVYIPALSLHVSIDSLAADKTICMRRFLRKELPTEKKGILRLSSRCMVELFSMACERFAVAGDTHAAIEEIYKGAMDFAKLNRDSAGQRRQIIATMSKTV